VTGIGASDGVPEVQLVESSVPTMLNGTGFPWSPGGIGQGW
jgi:hypothetical protein